MEFLKKFSNWKDVEEHDAQTIIFSEGGPADVLYVILSGEVLLSLRGEPLETAGEGSLIGEMAISSPDTRSATATSLTNVKLARIKRDQFNELMTESTEFSLHVMSELANRLRAVNRYIKNQFGAG